MSEYAERDPEKLEPHYSKHVWAMTEEDLNDKHEIAAELAVRDSNAEGLAREICALQTRIQELEGALEKIADQPTTHEFRKDGVDPGNIEFGYNVIISIARKALNRSE